MSFAAPRSIVEEFASEVTDSSISQERLKEIVGILERKLKASPSNPDIREYLGIALFRIGDTDGGLSKMKSALTVNPTSTTAGNMLLAYRRVGKWNDSLDVHLKYSDITTEPVVFSALLSGNYSQKVLNACRTDEQVETLKKAAKCGFPVSSVIRDIYSEASESSMFTISTHDCDGKDCFDVEIFTNSSAEDAVNVSDSVFQCLIDKYEWDVLERVSTVVFPEGEAVVATG